MKLLTADDYQKHVLNCSGKAKKGLSSFRVELQAKRTSLLEHSQEKPKEESDRMSEMKLPFEPRAIEKTDLRQTVAGRHSDITPVKNSLDRSTKPYELSDGKVAEIRSQAATSEKSTISKVDYSRMSLREKLDYVKN